MEVAALQGSTQASEARGTSIVVDQLPTALWEGISGVRVHAAWACAAVGYSVAPGCIAVVHVIAAWRIVGIRQAGAGGADDTQRCGGKERAACGTTQRGRGRL